MRTYEMRQRQKELLIKVKERTFDLQEANKILEEKQEEIQQQNGQMIIREENLGFLNKTLEAQKNDLQYALAELKATQVQMVQSEKMASVGTLITGIAHEIYNPLNFIQGGKTMIELYVYDNMEKKMVDFNPMFEMIDQGINHFTKIVQSLNQFSRKDEDSKELCDISYIIDNCLVIMDNAFSDRIMMVKEYTNSPYTIVGVEGDLHQAFLNILTNASQAIEGEGTITIRTKVLENNLKITITDTGHGIREEDIQRITDPFFTTKDPGEGSGLGLPIAYKIVSNHKGKIDFKSEPGIGTKVEILFPILS